ncbi:MAG: hypothetical protein AAF289_12440 [Cyanobacteria bacterium P01_A01_bin.135]
MEHRERSQANLNQTQYRAVGRRAAARRESLAAPGILMLSLVAVAAMVVSRFPDGLAALTLSPQPKSEAFRVGVNKAMSAAELTQTAQFREDWHIVATLWHEAIAMMQAVPLRSESYGVAQDKVVEYQQNLRYAQGNSSTQPPGGRPASVWSTHSSRELVTAIQGPPSRTLSLDSQCKEILYFGNSQVELDHGLVSQYNNIDNNLRVSFLSTVVAEQLTEAPIWTLGSSKDVVQAVEGIPDRVNRYDSLNMEVLYYGDDTVELREGFVVAYSNYGGTLNVSVAPLLTAPDSIQSPEWSIGDRREQVLRVEQAPTQIQRRDSFCEEVLHYDNSTVNLQNGVVVGYDNDGGTLQVR